MTLAKLTLFLLLFTCSTFIHGAHYGLLKVGTKAPNATLYYLKNKKEFKLSSFKGQFVYIDFWATWCGPCQEPMSHLNKLAAKHKKDWKGKLTLLAASIDKNTARLKPHIKKKKWTSVLHSYCIKRTKRKRKTAEDLFKISGVPVAYLLDKDGTIIWCGHPVLIDLEKTAANLLKGKKEVVFNNSDEDDESDNLKVGKKVPDTAFYSLKTNKKLKLSMQRGKLVYIDFWATWCKPCLKPMAHLNKLAKENKEKWKQKVCLIAASADKKLKLLKKRVKSKKWTAVHQCYMYNPKKPDAEALDEAFGIDGYPTAYLIGKDGKVLWQGHPEDIDLEKEINKRL